MGYNEALQWLEHLRHEVPFREDGPESYERLSLRVAGALASASASERVDIVDALRHWLLLRREPETMIALHIVRRANLRDLIADIESLLSEVQSGKALLPYYAEFIVPVISALRWNEG